jgi:MFS family permease
VPHLPESNASPDRRSAARPPGRVRISPRYAYGLLALFTLINLVNYLDRYVISPLVPAIRSDLRIDAAQAGLLSSAFIAVYMLASLPVGMLADRMTRKYIIGGGVLLWSIATMLSGRAPTYGWLLFARAVVGIGEASYACIVPAVLSDIFPANQRSRVLGIFYTAIPVGAALGIALGGHFPWRSAFYLGGIPGLVLAFTVFFIREPARGEVEATAEAAGIAASTPSTPSASPRPEPAAPPAPPTIRRPLRPVEIFRTLAANRAFVYATLGMTFTTFALGAFSFWVPSFLEQTRGLPHVRASNLFAIFIFVNGIVATLAGGWLADLALRRNRRALYDVSAWAMALALPVSAVAIFAVRPDVYLPAIFMASFFLLFNGGPLNAAIVNAVPAHIRASAIGVNLIVIHLLGDVTSPALVGWVYDRTHRLDLGMGVTLPAIGLAAVLLLIGRKYAPRLATTAPPA